MSKDAAQTYRQMTVQSASPLGLVLLLYDAVIQSLNRALRALDQQDVEKRVGALNHAIAVVGFLQNVLDHERGGEIARQLDRFYTLARKRMLEGSARTSREIIRDLTIQFSALRDSWQKVEESTAPSPSASEPDSESPAIADAGSGRSPASSWTA